MRFPGESLVQPVTVGNCVYLEIFGSLFHRIEQASREGWHPCLAATPKLAQSAGPAPELVCRQTERDPILWVAAGTNDADTNADAGFATVARPSSLVKKV